ncbi:MAG: nucleotidyltransferase domain-containing protein [Candidatus Omnitrophica bacterium]|nr:nucleotidyltransferase domain-containing protein [Candidatus Omnitrophota bacterium]
MLESLYLTKSRIRRKLLGLLFSNPSRNYYLSELARLVGTSPGNVRRELSRFIHDKLIKREKKGNLVLFSINPEHALFPELKSLILKTSGIEGALRELVNKWSEIQSAFIYGSFAKGTEKGESDIDLLIVSDGKLNNFYTQLSKLETLFGREINPAIFSPEEFKRKMGKREGFIAHVLREPHSILKGSLHEHPQRNSRGSEGKH